MENLIGALSKSNFDSDDLLNVIIKDKSLLTGLDEYLLNNDEILENQMLLHVLTVVG